MKRRWKVAIGIGGLVLAAALAPIVYIETACGDPLPGAQARATYRSAMPGDAGKRPEGRTWLTFPEWYIVYSADSFGRFLERAPPSAFGYGREVRGFWSGLCRVNRAAAGSAALGEAKVMLYTIGLSFTAELIAKGAYENTIGRLAEAIGGWRSADDRYAAAVQRRYGAFMHETPWYEFPFGDALSGLWQTREPQAVFRHWERRLALSGEYGVKAGYAGLIGWASGATLGRDELTLRLVARARPAAITAVDPRLRPVAVLDGSRVVVEAPRYAQFTELLGKLAARRIELVEIAGNDDVFVTLLVPAGVRLPAGELLISAGLPDRPGWRRVGITVKVARLLPLMREARAAGIEIEHVYDY